MKGINPLKRKSMDREDIEKRLKQYEDFFERVEKIMEEMEETVSHFGRQDNEK